MPTLLKTMHCRIWTWLSHDEGQGLTAYALVLTLIAIVAILALSLLGGKVTSALSTAERSL
jgi:Flp pilus assembly pilin Flp